MWIPHTLDDLEGIWMIPDQSRWLEEIQTTWSQELLVGVERVSESMFLTPAGHTQLLTRKSPKESPIVIIAQ